MAIADAEGYEIAETGVEVRVSGGIAHKRVVAAAGHAFLSELKSHKANATSRVPNGRVCFRTQEFRHERLENGTSRVGGVVLGIERSSCEVVVETTGVVAIGGPKYPEPTGAPIVAPHAGSVRSNTSSRSADAGRSPVNGNSGTRTHYAIGR